MARGVLLFIPARDAVLLSCLDSDCECDIIDRVCAGILHLHDEGVVVVGDLIVAELAAILAASVLVCREVSDLFVKLLHSWGDRLDGIGLGGRSLRLGSFGGMRVRGGRFARIRVLEFRHGVTPDTAFVADADRGFLAKGDNRPVSSVVWTEVHVHFDPFCFTSLDFVVSRHLRAIVEESVVGIPLCVDSVPFVIVSGVTLRGRSTPVPGVGHYHDFLVNSRGNLKRMGAAAHAILSAILIVVVEHEEVVPVQRVGVIVEVGLIV